MFAQRAREGPHVTLEVLSHAGGVGGFEGTLVTHVEFRLLLVDMAHVGQDAIPETMTNTSNNIYTLNKKQKASGLYIKKIIFFPDIPFHHCGIHKSIAFPTDIDQSWQYSS